jgi:hypothetical protein
LQRHCNPSATPFAIVPAPDEEEEAAMAVTKEAKGTRTVYRLEGTLLEVCSCGVLCPCWIGENPDEGDCRSVNAYKFDHGEIRGIDVSGLSFITVNHIPGNVLTPGSWRVVLLVDASATDEQKQAILDAFTGRLGGPLADLAGLVGEVMAVESVPVTHEVVGGRGALLVPGIIDADMGPYAGPDGTITTLRDSIFSTVPGSPAYVSKASRHMVNLPDYGMVWEYEGRNAIQSDYRIEHVA